MRKLSKKEKFIQLLTKTAKYKGDPKFTRILYRKFLTLLKTCSSPTRDMLFGFNRGRNKLYYISRGWSEEEAIEQVKLIQSRGLSFYNGDLEKIKQRVEKRKVAFSLKSKTEIEEINRKKSWNNNTEIISKKYNISLMDAQKKIDVMNKKRLDGYMNTLKRIGGYKREWSVWCVEYYLNKGHSIEEAKQFLIDKTKNYKRYSKKSLKVIETLITLCNLNDIRDITFLYADKEFHLYDPVSRKARWYDLTIPELNLIIEYNGEVFHPRKKDSMYYTVTESIKNDSYKKDIAKNNGYDILYIWERGSEKIQILEILNEIKNRYEQYVKLN